MGQPTYGFFNFLTALHQVLMMFSQGWDSVCLVDLVDVPLYVSFFCSFSIVGIYFYFLT